MCSLTYKQNKIRMDLNKLINRGLLTVYGPLALFIMVCILIANFIASNVLQSERGNFIAIMIIVAGFCIGWIWWSYKIVKWKYWAFSQTGLRKSYELYDKAIGVGLIWPTGSIFNKAEIWTKKDKENWEQLSPEIRAIFEVNKK